MVRGTFTYDIGTEGEEGVGFKADNSSDRLRECVMSGTRGSKRFKILRVSYVNDPDGVGR